MSLAKKEEVLSHRLVPRLNEPAAGVPIKKRPVCLPDRSVGPNMSLSMKPSSPAMEMPVSAAVAGCGKESFNIAASDANVITKGKGITSSQIQERADRSSTQSMANPRSFLFDGSNVIPSTAESDTRSFARVDESQHPNFLALDLRLPSHQNGKNNKYGCIVKEEKVDQGISGFSSAEPHKNAHAASEINASSNSVGKLPNLDLNVPLDPADPHESLPTMHESGSGLYHHTTNQHQKVGATPVAPISTTSSGLGKNIDSTTLNMSNSCGLSQNRGRGPADVTLDLQLKPPARPELGISWKGLAPAPELSLSLFGKPMDEPKSISTPKALFSSETFGSSKKISEEAAGTLRSDKAPVEKTVTFVPCKASPRNTTSSTVSGIDQTASKSNGLVKKEPEETSQQDTPNDAEKTHLLQRQSFGIVDSCTESEKADGPAQVPSKTGFDLNSGIFPDNSIHNELDVATDNVPVPAESLPDITCSNTIPVVPDVHKFVKREESTPATPTVVATVSCHSAPLMAAKSLTSESNIARTAVGLCESYSHPSVPTVCKPPATHVHAHKDTRQGPSDALPSSSNPTAEPMVLKSRDHATVDGMSQGSAEMDCSDDDGNIFSRFPTTSKPHGEPLENGPTNQDVINANNLRKELKAEQDSDMHQDCSSMTNKVSMEGVDSDRCVKIKASVVSHVDEQGHQKDAPVDEKSEGKQSLNSDLANNTDNTKPGVQTATGSSSTDLQRSSTSLRVESTRESPKTLDSCLEKTRRPELKSEKSPHGKQTASCNENLAKNAVVKTEHQTESEEVARQSDLPPMDAALGEDSELDVSSSQPHSGSGRVKSESEKSEYENSKPDSCKKSSAQNEKAGQLVGPHWRDLAHAYVNRNERWERFMESEREKNKGEYNGGRHASNMFNQRTMDYRRGGRGGGTRGHPRNFHGPRRSNEFDDEHINSRRRPFEDEPGHLHRGPHRRRHSPPPDCLMRELDIDGFRGRKISEPRLLPHGQIEDLQDDMMEDRFFMPHSHRHRGQADHGFIHRERSHSPAHRRGAPVHFHRGRSPEAMHRSPPLTRSERTFPPHCNNTRRHGSPLDRVGHDERGMQRNTRRCSMEEDAFEPPLHPAHISELHAEEELAGRRKYRERRVYLRSPVSEEDDMLSYHTEDDMDFAEGSGPREHDGRFRNRLGHRHRGEQEDGYRHRAPQQGWRDGDSNDTRTKRRRY